MAELVAIAPDDDGIRRQGAPIIHDDHFIAVTRIVQPRESCKAISQLPTAGKGGDDN